MNKSLIWGLGPGRCIGKQCSKVDRSLTDCNELDFEVEVEGKCKLLRTTALELWVELAPTGPNQSGHLAQLVPNRCHSNTVIFVLPDVAAHKFMLVFVGRALDVFRPRWQLHILGRRVSSPHTAFHTHTHYLVLHSHPYSHCTRPPRPHPDEAQEPHRIK